MRRWLVPLVLAALVALVAMPAAAASHGTDRPFKASFEGAVRWEFPGSSASGCTLVTTITEALGQATHLGTVSLVSTHCPAEADYVIDGRATFVAANGDELNGVYDYDPLSESNEIAFSFAGGTGRFANASGSAVWTYYIVPVLIEGCDDPEDFDCLDLSASWLWWSTLVGTVSY
jgi:hypothetical protein